VLRKPRFSAYTHPAGGWGLVQSVARSLTHEHMPFRGSRILMCQNKLDGFETFTHSRRIERVNGYR
jgi:hypothetical protein